MTNALAYSVPPSAAAKKSFKTLPPVQDVHRLQKPGGLQLCRILHQLGIQSSIGDGDLDGDGDVVVNGEFRSSRGRR
jgi:hypothetical protein